MHSIGILDRHQSSKNEESVSGSFSSISISGSVCPRGACPLKSNADNRLPPLNSPDEAHPTRPVASVIANPQLASRCVRRGVFILNDSSYQRGFENRYSFGNSAGTFHELFDVNRTGKYQEPSIKERGVFRASRTFSRPEYGK